jgi:hypothetical protein
VWFSIVLARADFYFLEETPEKVLRATEIAPRNTEYLALRALQLDYDEADSRALTEKIAELNPYASAPRIRLGLAAEIAGDADGAERWLLDAARVDHQFEPRWALANFYFRAGKRDEFWKWMRAALEVSYGDRTPAYELCRRVSEDGSEILRRGIPDRHEVVAGYLWYLLAKKPTESRLQPKLAALPGRGVGSDGAVVEAARRLGGYRNTLDLEELFQACDWLIGERDAGALEVWGLTGQGAPVGIFNGDFGSAPLNHGFDWRAIESKGVTHVHLTAPAGHRIALSGQEAESCLLLQHTLSIAAGKRYTVRWEARTAGIKHPSGLEWRVAGQHAALVPSEDWTSGEMTIDSADRFPVLELVYQRPVGESRAEGMVELRRLVLE